MFELDERFRVEGVTVISPDTPDHAFHGRSHSSSPDGKRLALHSGASHEPRAPGYFRTPLIGIVGALHGNELCGLHVTDALKDPGHPLRKQLKHGSLVLIHGNPSATAEGRRHTRGGTDLNRLFDYEFMENLPRTSWKYEHHRAAQLKPLLESLDAVLDLHSATEPSAPFVIAAPGQISIAEKLGCPYVTWGWDGPGLLANRVLASPLIKRGKIGLSVECGQHRSSESSQMALEVTERFLHAMGVMEGPAPSARPCTKLEVVHRICRPTLNFRFHRSLRGFDRLSPGELIGEGDGVRLTAANDYHVLLPNGNVSVGEDMLYLAEHR